MRHELSPELSAVFMHCPSQRLVDIRFVTDIFTLVTGVAANTALLWLFLRERKTLSASQVGTPLPTRSEAF